MPERIDHVTIGVNGRTVVITWTERTALLSRMGIHERAGESTKRKFSAVGASGCVELTADEKAWLLRYIDSRQSDGDEWTAWAGVAALSNALVDNLRHAEQRQGEGLG